MSLGALRGQPRRPASEMSKYEITGCGQEVRSTLRGRWLGLWRAGAERLRPAVRARRRFATAPARCGGEFGWPPFRMGAVIGARLTAAHRHHSPEAIRSSPCFSIGTAPDTRGGCEQCGF